MAVQVKTRQWGNSIGIVIPRQTVERLNIRADEEIVVEIHKKHNVLKELWGAFKLKKSTEIILKEAREELESKWSRRKSA